LYKAPNDPEGLFCGGGQDVGRTTDCRDRLAPVNGSRYPCEWLNPLWIFYLNLQNSEIVRKVYADSVNRTQGQSSMPPVIHPQFLSGVTGQAMSGGDEVGWRA